MLYKRKYLIQIHKLKSTVAYLDKIVPFEFVDEDGGATILFESQIGNFLAFETQLKTVLKQLSFKTKPWVKNSFYFSIANQLNQVQKRNFFDVGDFLGVINTYLLEENIAIQLTPDLASTQKEGVLILGVFDTKIELTIQKDLKIDFIKTWFLDKEFLPLINNLESVVALAISHLAPPYPIRHHFLITNPENKELTNWDCIKPFTPIYNKNKLVLEGLRIASENDINQMYDRRRIV